MKPAFVLVIAVVMLILGVFLGEYVWHKRPTDIEATEQSINYELLDVRRDAAVLTLINEERITDAQKLLASHLKAFVSESPRYESIELSDETKERLKKTVVQAKKAASEFEK